MNDLLNPNFTITNRASGVKVLSLHVPGKVNVLKMSVMERLYEALSKLKNDGDGFKGLIITSSNPDSFIAGADINEIDKLQEGSEYDAYKLCQRGKEILRLLKDLGAPTVAAIDGSTSGGGLELAMWCNYILISDNPKSEVSLKEVQLGLIPGFGGCVLAARRMYDLLEAVKFVATGSAMSGNEAWKAGLVDEVVQRDRLIERAEEVLLTGKVNRAQPKTSMSSTLEVAKGLLDTKSRTSAVAGLLAKSRKGRRLLVKQAVSDTRRKGKGFISPAEAVKVVIKSVDMPFNEALDFESQVFAKMCCGAFTDPATPFKIRLTSSQISRNLVDVFLDKSRVKHVSGLSRPGSISVVGVVGAAGAMGKEIGYVAALSDAVEHVVLVDIKQEFLERALGDIGKLFDRLVTTGRLTREAKAEKMAKIVISTDYSALSPCSVVIEAVRENIPDKLASFARIDEAKADCTEPYWIFSNTSALPLGELALGTKHPERFGGLHFFNPVSMMPLVECVEAFHTDRSTLATALALASAFGKVGIACRDKPGFIVNRVLEPVIIAIVWLMSMGVPPRDIDKAMLDAGFPMGGATLMDKVGLDIVASVAATLHKAFGERLSLPDSSVDVLTHLVQSGSLGMKSGKGIYLWQNGKPVFDSERKCNVINPELLEAFPRLELDRDGHSVLLKRWSREAILEIIFGIMGNEALRALEDGVVDEPYKIDLAMIFGAGYPAFLGGPLRNIDREGVVVFHDLSLDIAKSVPSVRLFGHEAESVKAVDSVDGTEVVEADGATEANADSAHSSEPWRLNFLPGELLRLHNETRRNIYRC
jgi:3-hydroxyacyl-CoA dehydrogenase/enoyl-CoA hydratase/3-hydroxybutyryl-CoA epimerase